MIDDWALWATKASKEIASLSPVKQGGADPEFVKGSYEEHWGKRIEGVKQKIAAGETIAHMLATMRTQPHQVQSSNRVSASISAEFLNGFTGATSEGVPTTRLGVSDSRFVAQPNFDPLTAIFKHARKADVIVELGSGPGWNLFNLSTYLGKSVGSKKIFGLEFSEAGLEITRLLSEHGQLPVEACFFDYTKPDLSILPTTGRMLIFSHHSIEQVEDISPLLHEMIARRRAPTKSIHCEPIGWQRFPHLVKARVKQNNDFFKALVVRRQDDLSSPHAVAINAAINSWRVKYNRNAMSCINKYVDRRFKVREAIFDFTQTHNSNPVNPSTYLEIDVFIPAVAGKLVTEERSVEPLKSEVDNGN